MICSFNLTLTTSPDLPAYHLRRTKGLHPSLTAHITTILIDSPIMSRLDYCDCLLSDRLKKSLYKLQLVQNSAARVNTSTAINPIPLSSHSFTGHQVLDWLHSRLSGLQGQTQSSSLHPGYFCLSHHHGEQSLESLCSQPTWEILIHFIF